MSATFARAEIWTDLVQAGGSLVCDVPVTALRRTIGPQGLLIAENVTGTTQVGWVDAVELRVDRVLLLRYSDSTRRQFRITSTSRGLSAGSAHSFEGAGIEQDMGRGEKLLYQIVNTVAVFSFTGAAKAPGTQLTDYVLPNLPSYFDLGTVTPTAEITADYTSDSPLSAALKIVGLSNLVTGATHYLSVRDASDSSIAIDITAYGASATVPDLRPGKNVRRLTQSKTIEELTNRVFVTGADGQSCGSALWEVSAVNAGVSIDIVDITGSLIPILLSNSQFATPYWVDAVGTGHAITSVNAALGRLSMASTTGIVVGDWGRIALNSALDEIPYVDDVARQPPIRIGQLRVEGGSSLTNVVRNAGFKTWAGSPSLPVGFTSAASAAPTQETGVGKWRTFGSSVKFSGGLQVLRYAIDVRVPAGWSVELSAWLKIEAYTDAGQGFVTFGDPGNGSTNFFVDGSQPPFNMLGAWLRGVHRYTAPNAGTYTFRVEGYQFSAAGVWYLDAISIMLVPPGIQAPTEFVYGSGGAALWLRGVQHLLAHPGPNEALEISVADLARTDPLGAGEYEALTAGGLARLVVPELGIDADYQVTQLEINELALHDTIIRIDPQSTTVSGSITGTNGSTPGPVGGTGGTPPGGGGGTGSGNPPPPPPGPGPEPVTPPSGGSPSPYPVTPLPDPATCQLFVDATNVGGVADGAAMTSWPDQSPVATAPSNTGATDRPLHRLADAEDGQPYVEFDGVNDFFRRTGMTEYTGTELTGYLVYRAGIFTGATDGIMSFAKAGGTDHGTTTRFCFLRNTQYRVTLNRNTVAYECNNQVQAQAVAYDGAFTWQVLAWRWKVVMGRGTLTMMSNNRIMTQDLGGTTLTALGFTAFFLGCRHLTGDGTTPDTFTQVHVRHQSYKHSADPILLMRNTLRYLAQKWAVPILG